MDWDDIAEWWMADVAADHSYRETVVPMLRQLLGDAAGVIVDLGCGGGSTMDTVVAPGRHVFGTDLSHALLTRAARRRPVVRGRLPSLAWLRAGAVDHAYSVYVVELLPDVSALFAEASRVVRPAGTLTIVVNHPAFTAPGAGPFIDQDGEYLWRWGDYFTAGESVTMAGSTPLTMHHRPVGALITAAGKSEWVLEEMIEAGFGPAMVASDTGYRGQDGLPRFLGVRWKRNQ